MNTQPPRRLPASQPRPTVARPPAPLSLLRTTLLAVSGMSPAILTETLWALAHEDTPCLPDEIIVVTTTRGRADLERELFTARPDWAGLTVWQALRRAILGPDAERDPRLQFRECRLVTLHDPATGRARELDDLRTRAENAAAAELLLDEVRRLTANDDTRLIASLAGGRKTMGALLHAAVSLLGRRQDRLTHILVSDPFDQPALRPRFFFPGQPGGHFLLPTPEGGTRPVPASQATLELADVPFVSLHNLFRDHLGRAPGGFQQLMQTAAGLVDDLSRPTAVDWQPAALTARWVATFDGTPVELTGRDIPFYDFLWHRARQGQPPLPSHGEALEHFLPHLRAWAPLHPEVPLDHGGWDWRQERQEPDADDLRKRLESLRNKLLRAGLGTLIPALFPVRGPLGMPAARLEFPLAPVPPKPKRATPKSTTRSGGATA